MNTTVNNAALIEDKLSSQAILSLNGDESLLNTISDYSALLAADGKTALVPVMGTGSGIQVKAEGDAFTLTDVDSTQVTIDVNKNAGDAFTVSDALADAAKANYVSLRSEQIVSTLKDFVNTDVIATINAAVPVGQEVGTGATDISADFVRQAAVILDDARAPTSDRFLVLSSTQYYKIAALEEFNRSDYNTSVTLDAKNMIQGTIYGFNVVRQSNTKVAGNNIAYHKLALGFASTKRVGIESQRDVLRKATNFVVDMRYGVKSLMPDYSVRIHTL